MQLLREWLKRYFSDPQVVILGVFLISGAIIIYTLGSILTPILASIVIAYLLEGFVGVLERRRIPRLIAVLVVFLIFTLFLIFFLFWLLPIISIQAGQVVSEFPSMISKGQQELMRLPERYPEFISPEQPAAVVEFMRTELMRWGQKLLSFSVASVRGLVTFMVYIVLLPLLVFFFLKDKDKIVAWFTNFFPENRPLSNEVWQEVDRQIGNYVRGKFWEILIIWAVSYATFLLVGLKFAMLIAMLVGLSVLVPYIGVTVVFFPVAMVAFYQFGPTSHFVSIVLAYTVIQLLDGNLLAPLLLSEVVNLHPVAIMSAVLIFGGLWGFWGVFFAIPLATLVQAVIQAWPKPGSSVLAAKANAPPKATADPAIDTAAAGQRRKNMSD